MELEGFNPCQKLARREGFTFGTRSHRTSIVIWLHVLHDHGKENEQQRLFTSWRTGSRENRQEVGGSGAIRDVPGALLLPGR